MKYIKLCSHEIYPNINILFLGQNSNNLKMSDR